MEKNKHFGMAWMLLAVIAIVAAGAIQACKKSVEGGPGPDEVWMKNTQFDPASITIPLNTTLKWTNMDATDHTVTSDSGLFDSGTIHGGGIYTFTFTNKGTFPYRCIFHPGMVGKVIVN